MRSTQIIALNTFWILFLRWKLKRYVLVVAMLGGWSAIGAFITAGPASIQQVPNGPFCELSVDSMMVLSDRGRRRCVWVLVLDIKSVSG